MIKYALVLTIFVSMVLGLGGCGGASVTCPTAEQGTTDGTAAGADIVQYISEHPDDFDDEGSPITEEAAQYVLDTLLAYYQIDNDLQAILTARSEGTTDTLTVSCPDYATAFLEALEDALASEE